MSLKNKLNVFYRVLGVRNSLIPFNLPKEQFIIVNVSTGPFMNEITWDRAL